MPITGNTATIVFGTSAWTGAIIEITGLPEEVPVLNKSTLSTSGDEELMPGDLTARTPITIRAYADMDNMPPLKTVETTTITYQKKSGQTNGATLAGTGFINSRTGPTNQNNQLCIVEFTFQFDGVTGPTYTDGA